MKKYCLAVVAITCIALVPLAHANWFADIVNRIEITNVLTRGILDSQAASLGIQRDILTSQKEIESLMNQLQHSVTGNSGWGNYRFQDYQSYGNSARDWTSVLQMAEAGQGNGQLGQMIGGIANQFPVDAGKFNKGVTDPHAQKYYAVKSQTVLATRAASQLDYNKIQDQITYQQMLQQQIEKTKDLKAAVDLSSRIQVEGNLINLEILRQNSLSNQQQAITEQAAVNAALSNAKFLTKN